MSTPEDPQRPDETPGVLIIPDELQADTPHADLVDAVYNARRGDCGHHRECTCTQWTRSPLERHCIRAVNGKRTTRCGYAHTREHALRDHRLRYPELSESWRCPVTTLPLPPLVGTRNRARALTEGLPDNLSGARVIVDGSNLLASTASFVDELIKQILVQRDAKFLQFDNVEDDEFVHWLRDRAQANSVQGRIGISRSGGEGGITETL